MHNTQEVRVRDLKALLATPESQARLQAELEKRAEEIQKVIACLEEMSRVTHKTMRIEFTI